MVVVRCTLSYVAYTCMKFYEHILNGFLSYRTDMILSQKLLLTKFKGMSLKKLWFLHSACRLMLIIFD